MIKYKQMQTAPNRSCEFYKDTAGTNNQPETENNNHNLQYTQLSKQQKQHHMRHKESTQKAGKHDKK